MLREARIILPNADNDGLPLTMAHAGLARTLCATFGGLTAVPVRGMWVGPNGKLYDEPGTAYDVAADDTPANRAALIQIARDVGQRCQQEAMYVRFPSGDVTILNTAPSELAAA